MSEIGSLQRLAGGLLWCGWGAQGEDPSSGSPHLQWILEELGAGGVVLFDRNLGCDEEIFKLTRRIRRGSRARPLVGVDQEGGRVCRILRPGLVFPGNMALGALDDLETTRKAAETMALQLATLGFDTPFAPCLDVNSNPRNPIIGVRSFGDSPDVVARHGIAAMKGIESGGLLPVIKHFPGHGDTNLDSHLELPVQPAGRARLESVELAPFRAAIAAGAPAVMTTHILFPELDAELPATLSASIVGGLLRGEMGFDGLVVSDCLEMAGISAHWSPEETAVLAMKSGVDLLLVCHTREVQQRMRDALVLAVQEGRLSEARLWEAKSRIERVRWNLPPRPSVLAAGSVGSAPAAAFESEVSRRSILHRPGRKPFRISQHIPLVILGAAELGGLLERALADLGVETCHPADAEEVSGDRIRQAPQLLLAVTRSEPWPDGELPGDVKRAIGDHPACVVISAGEPSFLAVYPEDVTGRHIWVARESTARAAAALIAAESSGDLA